MNGTIIGNIIFSDYINEAEVTGPSNRFRPKKIGECKVEVYAGEGPSPHFHIIGIHNKFDCCVRIYDNHFFEHGIYRDTLNSGQCKELYEWMKKRNDREININKSNWKAIADAWNNSNPDCIYPEDKKCSEIPRYDLMRNFKSGI